jgi:hypothetical protein
VRDADWRRFNFPGSVDWAGLRPPGMRLDRRVAHPPVSSAPVEICEICELCELCRQDAMESFNVKGRKWAGVGFFLKRGRDQVALSCPGADLFKHF